MKHPSRLERGSVLGGRYRIVRKIGSGGMSHVYLAEDLKLSGKKWAVKESVILPEHYGNIISEAEMLIALQHPRLPQIVDFFEPNDEGFSYLVMDYINGKTLQEHLHQNLYNIPVNQMLNIIHQIMEVLDYMHRLTPPMIYRDLKPGNIMITDEGEIRLIDFGIARKYKQKVEEDTIKLGTIGFAAPEQFGSGQTDGRSDLYSLGALFLYMATRGTHSEWIPGVEQMLGGLNMRSYIPVIRRLLRHEPEARYQSIGELREEMYRLSAPAASRSTARNEVKIAQGTCVIALIGTGPGTGVTHTAIAISHYLARAGNKVAVAELSQRSGAFARIRSIALGESDEIHTMNMFEIDRVHYFQKRNKYEIIGLLGGSYEYVVLDMGHERDQRSMEEFFRSDLPIVVSAAAEWKHDDLALFLRSYDSHPKMKWTYLLPLASRETVTRIRKSINSSRVYSVPLHFDPFDRSDDMDKVLAQALSTFMPEGKRKRFLFI